MEKIVMIFEKSPTILVTNFHSIHNKGDLALLECTLHQLKTAFFEPKIFISANRMEEINFLGETQKIIPSPWSIVGAAYNKPICKQLISLIWGIFLSQCINNLKSESINTYIKNSDWKYLFDYYKKADLIIGVPGNQFYSTGHFGWPFPVTSLSVYFSHLFSKPFYTMPQSIGPLKRNWERTILRQLYSKARFIFLRDQTSISLAKDIGIPQEKIFYSPDLGFNYPPGDRQTALDILKIYGYSSNILPVGATIIPFMGRTFSNDLFNNYYNSLAYGFTQLIKKYNIHLFLFIQVSGPTVKEDDRIGIQNLLNLMGDVSNSIHFVNKIFSPGLLKSCYGLMEFFIPTRLHSGIFALGMQIPSFFIGYLSKTRGVLESIGLEEWMIDINDLEPMHFWTKLETAWLNRNQLREDLNLIIPTLKSNINNVGKIIAEDFYLNVAKKN